MVVTNTDVPVQTCSSADRTAFIKALDRLGGKWTILVIAELFQGPLRYNELQRRVGPVSQRMLTLSLKALTGSGLVLRTAHPSIPPHVDYELTALGFTLKEALQPLWEWALLHMGEHEVEHTTSKPVASRLRV